MFGYNAPDSIPIDIDVDDDDEIDPVFADLFDFEVDCVALVTPVGGVGTNAVDDIFCDTAVRSAHLKQQAAVR